MRLKRERVEVDERGMIDLLRRGTDSKLEKHATKLPKHFAADKGAPDQQTPASDKRIANTVLSPGLKLATKVDIGTWPVGSLWIVADAVAAGSGNVTLVHVKDGKAAELVVPISELDAKFELR